MRYVPVKTLHHPSTLFRDSELLVKGLGARLAPKELLQKIHFLARATAFKHRVAVAAAFLGAHGVGLEDSVEHVGRVDLRREVAVVTSMTLVMNGTIPSGLWKTHPAS
jgi:hypothetical protein